MRSLRTAAAAVVLCVAGPGARADEEPVRGTVLRVEGENIFVDLGVDSGVGGGSDLTLLHVVNAVNPVTHKKLRDRFPIGQLAVINAGKALCVAHTDDDAVRHRVAVGDEVELASAPRTFVDPWQESIRRPPGGPAPAPDERGARALRAERAKVRTAAAARVAEEEAAREAWEQTLGKAPRERIAVWGEYLSAHPRSPYAEEIRTEVSSLEQQVTQEEERSSGAAEERRTLLALDQLSRAAGASVQIEGPVAWQPPTRGYEGAPIELSLLLLAPSRVGTAWIHWRRTGDSGYQTAELQRAADGYLVYVLQGESVRPPAVQYFIDAQGGDEEPTPLIGSAADPRQVAVDASVEEPPPDVLHRSRITLFADYVDFDGFNRNFDQYLQAEVDFMYRWRSPIYAMRVGFGTLGGYGGPKDIIDRHPEDCTEDGVYYCRKVSYHYAYTELEFRLKDVVALMVRPVIGSAYLDPRREEGEGREFFSAFGVRTRLRLGHEQATNLALGVSLTERLGSLFEAAFTWDVIPRFPIVLSAQVTDQPVPEDYGVRLITDVGWRGVSWVYPSIRIAYQARDLDHAGISGGLAANFDW